MVVAFYFRLHLAYFPRPVVAIFARPEHFVKEQGQGQIERAKRKGGRFAVCVNLP